MNIETKTQEILKAHGLDFKIKKGPLTFTDEDGKQYLTPYYGLQNDKSKEVINTCKEGYTVSQNEDVIKMMLQGIEKFGSQLTVKKAGSINGGRRVFVQLEIAGKTKIGNDTITRYITGVDSNDGSTGLSIGVGDKAAHCLNEFFRFYKGSNAKFRHTATIAQKIATIPHLIELALAESMKQMRVYDHFQSTKVSKNLADKLVKEVLGYDRVFTSAEFKAKMSKRSIKLMDTLYDNIETEYKAVGQNLWGLFNGLTRFTTHEGKVYQKENGKMESMLLGTNYKKAIKGFNLLKDIV